MVKETLRLRSVLTDRGPSPDRAGARSRATPCRRARAWPPASSSSIARARLYPEPLAFRPERFLDGGPEPYSWIPFGGGVRRCLGAGFALLEMREVLRTVVLRARLSPAHPEAERPRRRGVTITPDGDALAVLDGWA